MSAFMMKSLHWPIRTAISHLWFPRYRQGKKLPGHAGMLHSPYRQDAHEAVHGSCNLEPVSSIDAAAHKRKAVTLELGKNVRAIDPQILFAQGSEAGEIPSSARDRMLLQL